MLRASNVNSLNRVSIFRIWFVNDSFGILCSTFTWIYFLYIELYTMSFILVPSPYLFYKTFNTTLFQILALLAFSSHLRTMLSDPGAVPNGLVFSGKIDYSQRPCGKCCVVRPRRTHHCSVCQRCIRKMDHHCPFVNNCVGENNQKFFFLFTFYTAAISTHVLILAIEFNYECEQFGWLQCAPYSPAVGPFLLYSLIFFTALFAAITTVMVFRQISVNFKDQTYIERIKNIEPSEARGSIRNFIKSVFQRFSLAWFSPFTNLWGNSRHDYNF